MNDSVKGMLKDTLVLFAITLIAGLVLGVVFQVTKAPIAAQEEKAKQEACMEVFAEASAFETVEAGAAEYAGEFAKRGYGSVDISQVMKAVDADGNVMGFVLTVITHEGYAGDIEFMMGIKGDGTVNGISLLAISETAGLGMRAEEVLKPQFADKNVESFEVTKMDAISDSQIDAISGATITTDAITGAVNAGLYYFQTELLGGGGNE